MRTECDGLEKALFLFNYKLGTEILGHEIIFDEFLPNLYDVNFALKIDGTESGNITTLYMKGEELESFIDSNPKEVSAYTVMELLGVVESANMQMIENMYKSETLKDYYNL